MANQFSKAVTTDLGRALVAAAASEQKALEFTSVSTGDGVYTDEEKTREALAARTALKSEKQNFPISGHRHLSEYVAKITSVLSNEGLEEAYYWNEVGIYARLEGSAEAPILFSIAVIAQGTGTEIPAYSPTTVLNISQSFYFQISNAVNTTILVNHDTCELLEYAGLNSDLITDDTSTLVAAINELKTITNELEDMIYHNHFYGVLADDDGNHIVDDDGSRILGDWKFIIA